jgi:histidinol dehydrogenase
VKIIRDIDEAKAALQRSSLEPGTIPPGMRQRIRDVFGEDLTADEAVVRIVTDVRQKGDTALLDYMRRVDGVELDSLEVDDAERRQAHEEVDSELASALRTAAEQVRSFHQQQMNHGFQEFSHGGLGQVVRPIERVGIYVPGGTASYPSTVLMTAIPARVAGVAEVIIATPPKEGGRVPPSTLVAADIAQVDRVFRMGGAQAIAALAYGTESVPRVDKVCGPGGLFVILAKRMVYGTVDIDGLPGPTETVIVADETASPAICAADLLAQAEHDVLASAVMVTTSSTLAEETSAEVERQLGEIERAEIARESIERQGIIIVVDSIDQAVELANLYAPEHLSLMVRDAPSLVEKVRNAGGIFVGESTPETLGDYAAGPSHVMPTGGTARFRSPLGVADFLKLTSVVALSGADLQRLGPVAATIARAEGFTAHARAVEMRLDQGRRQE